jgi:4-amino-4-deoxy-L-arabinose transferase-like glycosyltransferase
LALYVAAMLVLPAREGWAGDEPEYLNLADNLLHGFYREGTADGPLDMCFPGWQTPDLWYGPGFPALLAPLVGASLPVSVIRLVGPLLLLAAVLLLYLALDGTVSRRAALAGALGLGLFLPFLRYLPHLHSEFLALALVTAAMLALSRLLHTGRPPALAAAAAALTGVALTRVAYGWVLSILFLVWLVTWLVRRSERSRRLALAHGLALVLCLPWLAYTYSVTERPFLWGTSGSLSLYWMSSPYPADRGDWHCANDVFEQDWLAPHRPFFLAHRDETPSEQNRALERQALEHVREHPSAFAGNVAANASRILFNTPYSRRGPDTRTLFFLLPGLVLVTLLAVAAVRLMRACGSLPAETAAFGLFAAVAFAVHLPISAYVRMLIPITPLLVWLVVVGVATVPRRLDENGPHEP